MKLSLSWIFDHLALPFSSIDRTSLYTLLNEKVVEIDKAHDIQLDPSYYALARFDGTTYEAHTSVTSFSLSLAHRNDLVAHEWYLVVLKNNQWEWATMKDLGSTKELLIPSLTCNTTPADALASIEWNDHVLEISNSSLTHRPDLWSHRGFAREISTVLNIPLLPMPSVNVPVQKESTQWSTKRSPAFPFDLTIETKQCRRLVATVIPVTHCSSFPFIAARLSRIDIRPISAVVDGTNSVMATIGHPLHAFDADKIHNNTLIVTQKAEQSLTLLDQQEIITTQNDIIICDDRGPLSLAGVMGGADSRVTHTTDTVLIEGAYFTPSTIRATAQRHKKKTEGATRFEKGLDADQALEAVKQYLQYAQQYGLIKELPQLIVDLGPDTPSKTITVQHKEINALLGTAISPSFVTTVLTQLGCIVTQKEETYTVTIPSFRAHEMSIKEDIIEEIGRMYGYAHIAPEAPPVRAHGKVNHKRLLINGLRHILAFGMSMHELKNYAFFDEGFIQTVGWDPHEPVPEVEVPVSQNWKRLVNCLVPGILKAVVSNGAQHKQSRFFEIAPVWHIVQETQEIKETLSLAFIINDSTISFHQGKSIVDLVFQLCGKKATWMQCTRDTAPFWLIPFESAALMIKEKCIGHAGMLQEMIHKKLGKDVAKHLFVVHLSLDALVAEGNPLSLTVPSKYQSVQRDITFWVPKTCPAATVVETARANTEHITSIKQLSFLEKEEWDTHRALTVRCAIGSSEKTLTTEEIDTVVETIIQKVHSLGVTVK